VSPVFGGVELGGTKVVCAVGTAAEIGAETRFPTGAPETTLERAAAWLEQEGGGELAAVGVASFGPLELRPAQPSYGSVRSTPKPGWSNVDLVGLLRGRLGLPVGFDTDVNGAALAEGRLGAALGAGTFLYVTVGTGIGAGVVAGGRLVAGLVHPELGHLAVPREPGDDFPGTCPYHGDCLEGLASGPALERRFGDAPERLRGSSAERACGLAAAYVAAGLRNAVYTVAPERIVVGGGVSRLPGFLPEVRTRLRQALGGYPGLPEHDDDSFVLPPALGDRAGVLGALLLAEQAAGAPG
jgi:fructokinase